MRTADLNAELPQSFYEDAEAAEEEAVEEEFIEKVELKKILIEGLKEVRLIKEGKLKGKPIEELLNELYKELN